MADAAARRHGGELRAHDDDFHTYFVGEVGAWVHNCTKLNRYWAKKLRKASGLDEHRIKQEALGNKAQLSRYDLFFDDAGEVVVKPKDGSGPGVPTGYRKIGNDIVDVYDHDTPIPLRSLEEE